MSLTADDKAWLTGTDFKLFIRGCVIDVLNDPTHTYLRDEFAPTETSLGLLITETSYTPTKTDLDNAVAAIEAHIDQALAP